MTNTADAAIAFALSQVGKPYKFGTDGPDTYDCSGLIYASYKHAGLKIGRDTAEQIFDGVAVAKADIQPGDLVFPEPTHVQMAIGGGQVVVAPHTGTFVRVEKIGTVWRVRRVAEPGADATEANPVLGRGNVTDVSLPNPFAGASEFGKVASTLSSVDFWRRVGAFSFGAFLILVGVIVVFHKGFASAAKTGVKAAEIGAVL